ncbi:oligopeptidase A [Methylovulum psychrotolerans]|uniref:oligopeptidase A n=1 Tax=Methylovulum psychrotolerans TaxID=1704499 RepID=A0A1Z4BXB4_9GAMM|nr:oligopeptidase A [Methylovulum psychrotolerans]ASF45901.1 oligopeptidase A [Methylovulum psychrotolerans]
MNNPLLTESSLPLFSEIKPEHVVPAIDQLLADARETVAECLKTKQNYNWAKLIQPIADAEDRLNKAWSPVSHLNSVCNNEALREAYNACLPKLSDYGTEMGQNKRLFYAYRQIAKHSEFSTFDTAQQKIVRNALRDFRLSGVDLSEEKKQRYKEICQELSQHTSHFEENVLDATNAWSKSISHKRDLVGMPESAIAQAKQAAEQAGEEGWLLTLQFPSYNAVMTYADSRELRREIYEAYTTRASEIGPHGGHWDNSLLMEQILSLRHEKAKLLGFNNFAELSLSTKMAKKPEEVISFLEDLAHKSWRQARNDLIELQDYTREVHAFIEMEPWDIGYYSEKMRQHLYQLSQEEVKSYFPITRVLPGLFAVVERLYGLQISEITEFDTWHPDVQLFQIHDKDGQLRGKFYTDLFARTKKRGGAWMDDCVGRKKTDDHIQIPVAYLTCNFTPPTADTPALLTHDEVTTLFHEFGHGLHHVLTQVDYLGVSGINGVEWDAVELPSQFMENWCWEKDALALMSGHYQTGEVLPDSLFAKMLAAKNFQAGLFIVRQLEFSLFDFRMHLEYDPERGGRIYEILDQVRNQVAVIQAPKFNRFPHSFTHIFAGGYAAGYYSYKWAEVLSSDAYSLFEEKGVFDEATGQSFLTNILEKGGSKNAMELFVSFRGREPNIDALLRHNGITA